MGPDGGTGPRAGGDPDEAVGVSDVGVVLGLMLGGGKAEYSVLAVSRGGAPLAVTGTWMYPVVAREWLTN